MAKLQLDDYLPTLEETSLSADGRPLLLPVDLIDEDPAQPRHEFDADALSELAASVGTRGVLQPVSVRRHPERAERYMLNFGARRLRASKLAGKTDIPVFVDALASTYDQVIENEHREALRPMELALFVKRQLDAGQTQADVASRLGKSRAYVCYISALIDPPDWLTDLYRDGRCRGVKELYDLRRLHEEHPQSVERFAAAQSSVARADIDALREQLASAAIEEGQPTPAASGSQNAKSALGAASRSERSNAASFNEPRSRARWTLLAEAGSSTVELDLSAMPAALDEVYVVEAGARIRQSVKVAALQRLRLQRRK